MTEKEFRQHWKGADRFVQAFIRKNRDKILTKSKSYGPNWKVKKDDYAFYTEPKSRQTLAGKGHPLYGCCYPAAWFFHYLYSKTICEQGFSLVVSRRPMEIEGYGNHTFCLVYNEDGKLFHRLDPNRNQVGNKHYPDGSRDSLKWYRDGAKKSPLMVGYEKMPHKMTLTLIELWYEQGWNDRDKWEAQYTHVFPQRGLDYGGSSHLGF